MHFPGRGDRQQISERQPDSFGTHAGDVVIRIAFRIRESAEIGVDLESKGPAKQMSELSTDAALLERWSTRSDVEAFTELVSRHSAMVYTTCKRILQNDAGALLRIRYREVLDLVGLRLETETAFRQMLQRLAERP